jgi:hypothetical protein
MAGKAALAGISDRSQKQSQDVGELREIAKAVETPSSGHAFNQAVQNPTAADQLLSRLTPYQ